jgi:hypothetical protein
MIMLRVDAYLLPTGGQQIGIDHEKHPLPDRPIWTLRHETPMAAGE